MSTDVDVNNSSEEQVLGSGSKSDGELDILRSSVNQHADGSYSFSGSGLNEGGATIATQTPIWNKCKIDDDLGAPYPYGPSPRPFMLGPEVSKGPT